MKNIVILISGRGSNMEAIVKAAIPNTRIAAVVSNTADAAGLKFAAARGIPTVVVPHRDYDTRESFDAALIAAIEPFVPDVVVLAGFMRILTPIFVNQYAGRLLNIHPSLLPALTGLHTHQRALDLGLTIHGCTVHFVTATLDHGPVVIQAAVPVMRTDTEASLAARVLTQEHCIYPYAVAAVARGDCCVEGGKVVWQTPIDEAPLSVLQVPAVA